VAKKNERNKKNNIAEKRINIIYINPRYILVNKLIEVFIAWISNLMEVKGGGGITSIKYFISNF